MFHKLKTISILPLTALLYLLCMSVVYGEQEDARIVAFTRDEQTGIYATGNTNLEISLWNERGERLVTIQAPDLRRNPNIDVFYIGKMVFSPDSEKLAVSFDGYIARGMILVIDTKSAEIVLQIDTPAPVNAIDWSPDGIRIAGIYAYSPTTRPSGYLALWSAETGDVLAEDYLGETSPIDLDWHPTDDFLAFTQGTHVVIWDTTTWLERVRIFVDKIGATSVAWNTDGSLLASIGAEYTVRIWDTENFELQREIQDSESQRYNPKVFWQTNSDILGVISLSQVQVWNVHNGEVMLLEQTPIMAVISDAVLTETGRLIFSDGDLNTVDEAIQESDHP